MRRACRFGGSENPQLEHFSLAAPLVQVSPHAAEHPPSDGEQVGRQGQNGRPRFTSRREQPGRTASVAARSRGKAYADSFVRTAKTIEPSDVQ
jgi:hypothetical protein